MPFWLSLKPGDCNYIIICEKYSTYSDFQEESPNIQGHSKKGTELREQHNGWLNAPTRHWIVAVIATTAAAAEQLVLRLVGAKKARLYGTNMFFLVRQEHGATISVSDSVLTSSKSCQC